MIKMKDVTPDWRAEDFHPPSSTLMLATKKPSDGADGFFVYFSCSEHNKMKVSRGLETLAPRPTVHYTTRAFGWRGVRKASPLPLNWHERNATGTATERRIMSLPRFPYADIICYLSCYPPDAIGNVTQKGSPTLLGDPFLLSLLREFPPTPQCKRAGPPLRGSPARYLSNCLFRLRNPLISEHANYSSPRRHLAAY